MLDAILWDYDGTIADTPVKNLAVTKAVLFRLVYVALAAEGEVRVREVRLGQGRERIRHTAASHALDMARRAAAGLPEPADC